ncbi:MAG: FAD-binding oxidoreductase [Alphaproteobacteria bacterium]|nr:FAD-binding oxidoreductase [Alphaproteobacteria bacterium]
MKPRLDCDVVIIGGGIIGYSIALSLQKTGKTVLIIDRNDKNCNASRKNAGAFAFADLLPLATPEVLLSAPKWLLDPTGPLYVHPGYIFSVFPWMMRFWQASWHHRFNQSLIAQASLMALSREALEKQVIEINAEFLLQRKGQLRLYQDKEHFRKSAKLWLACEEHNVPYELLSSTEQIAEVQPGLDNRFMHAGYTPNWINVSDPNIWMQYIKKCFVARGGRQINSTAGSISPMQNSVMIKTDKCELNAAFCVVAAGAWSKKLASGVGDRIPLDTERGYNITLKETNFELDTHLTFAEHGFVISNINHGIRVGGAVEFAGLNRVPNFRRADTLLNKAENFLPVLRTATTENKWMGFRPSLPDSLPVIDHSALSRRVLYAFGHGHLGLTQAAGTAEIVRDLIIGQSPKINVSAFSAKRF